MQLYVLDRAKNTLATTSSFYSDKHHKELTAGASIFEFTIDKSDSAAQYMTTGNYLVFLDDRGRAWSFTILSYDETQTTKTVAAEDVSIELLNKAMDIWNTDQAYPFSYYFNLVTKGTPWTLGVNQLTDLSRKLVYTGRDTGLGRLLSVLKGFDKAECQFNIKVQQNKPVEFTVDVYKSIGTVQDNIQIVYNNELADIKKTESRAQFVTALAGIGGLVENQATTDPGLEKHIDFADIAYKDDNFISPKGDKFLRAVTANRTFNPGTTTYIEDFYDYDTQSAQELLNRTLTQLKERSEPQYTYDADVKVIDPTLDIGDTVTIIDHDYNPALYLQARVAMLDKSYTDPTQGAITFCNYRVLNSNLSDQLRAMQNIIDQLPTSASIKVINNNIVQMITQNEELKKQVALSFESANGKSRVWFSKSATAQDGDVAFIKNADGATEIWKFVEGAWKLDTGLATFDDVKKAASAAADAGSQAVIAGQQASAAGADAKSAGDFAASAASQSTIETAAAKSAANSAVNQANLAISQAGFANNAADQAKSAAASAQSDAADALAEATKSFNDAQNAISNATKAMDAAEQNRTTVTGLVTKVDDIAGTIQTLATTQSVDKLAGTVTTVQNLAQFAADGLKLKADTTTVNQINGTVNDLKGELDVQADKIAATVTASDVTGMLGNYATQSWSQGQISAAKNEITASVETVRQTVDNMQVGGRNLIQNSDFSNGLSGWLFAGVSARPADQLFAQSTGEDLQRFYTSTNPIESIPVGGDYVISFEAYSTIPGIVVEVGPFDKRQKVTLASASHRYVLYFTRTADIDSTAVSFVFANAGDSAHFSHIKMESGNLATAWSPAFEDGIAHTDTAVANLKLTVDGLSTTFAKQSDLQTVSAKTNTTADGLSAIVSVTGSKAEKVTTLIADVHQIKTTMTGDGGYTSRLQTLEGFQQTATSQLDGKASQSQVTQLSNQYTSVVKSIADISVGGTNLLANSSFSLGMDNWTMNGVNATSFKEADGTPSALLTSLGTDLQRMYDAEGCLTNIPVGATFIVSLSAYTVKAGSTLNVGPWDSHQQVKLSQVMTRYILTFTKNSATNGSLSIGLSNMGETAHVAYIKVEVGTLPTAWSPAPEDLATNTAVSSQITQLQSDINLRVKTGDLVSQIDVNAKRILLDGASTYITNTTHIDTGVIKTAMIADAAINNAKIANAAIDNAKIANASITAAKIADLAVGSAQIADGAISSAKIGNAAITSAQIADASILDAKIVSLDGSKIVAHSITADKLDVNAIAVGLNTYGAGWQITPRSIAFLPSASSTKASLAIDGTGIQFNDIGNGETLAMLQGTPYNTTKDAWYNGMLLDLSPNNDYVAMVDESGSAAKTKVAWSRSDKTDFGMYSGFNFYDHVHFNTIGPFDYDTHSRLKIVRVKIADRWCTGFMNSNNNQPNTSGIVFTDDGATYLGRAGRWYNLVDIVNKLGLGV